MTLVCYDSVNPANLPAGADVYGVYVDGRYVNEAAVRARFPNAHIITIAVQAVDNADCLDVEKWDAFPSQAPGWVRRQLGRGMYRPILYASNYLMPTVLAALSSAGISRDTVRLWSAHYVNTRHICSPATCHAPFTADGTQWAGSPGNSPGPYDISVLSSTFFDPAPKPPAPVEDDPDMPVIIRCSDPNHSGATLVVEQGVVVSLSMPADLAQYEKPTPAPLRTVSPGTFDQYAARTVK